MVAFVDDEPFLDDLYCVVLAFPRYRDPARDTAPSVIIPETMDGWSIWVQDGARAGPSRGTVSTRTFWPRHKLASAPTATGPCNARGG